MMSSVDVRDYEDHSGAGYDIFSFEISQHGGTKYNRNVLGIDALSPHTDDVIFPMKNTEGRGSFSSSSIIGGGTIGSMPSGEQRVPTVVGMGDSSHSHQHQYNNMTPRPSTSWGEQHHQSPPPPHIVGLFSPSDRSDSFMRSLSLSPRITPTPSYVNEPSPLNISRGEDDANQLLSPREHFQSKLLSPKKSPRVFQSEHEEFLSGMGGMELDLDELDDDEEDEDGNFDHDALLSPTSAHLHSIMGFTRSFLSHSQQDDLEGRSGLSSSFMQGMYEQGLRGGGGVGGAGAAALSGLGELEGIPCTATFGEHPYGEHPSRTLFVRNINSNVDDDELASLFEAHGPIRSMYTQCKHRGFVMISYYDIRHAKNAMRHLQGKIIRRRKLDIHYSIPKDNPSEKDQNQGTLVIFNLDPSTSNEELKSIFGQFGEIKEIRETPNKKHHKFIEFFDVRDSEKAMKHLNKTDIKGKKIKIEPSRPGGARKNQMNQLAFELGEDDPSSPVPGAHPGGSVSPMPSGFLMSTSSAPSPTLYYSQQPFSPPSPLHSPSYRKAQSSPQLNQTYAAHIHSLVSPRGASGSTSPSASPRSSPSPIPSPVIMPTHTPIPIPSSAIVRNTIPGGGSGGFHPVPSHVPQQEPNQMLHQDPSTPLLPGMISRQAIDRLSLNFGDHMSLIPTPGNMAPNQGPVFQPRQGSFVRPLNTAALGLPNMGPAPNGSLSERNSPLPTATSSSSFSSSFMSSSAPAIHNPNSRWNPIPSDQLNLRFSGEMMISSPPSSTSSTPTHSPRIAGSMNNGMSKNGGKSPRGQVVSAAASGNPNDMASINNNKKGQQEDKAQYTLHIERVRGGVDTRTTLMIKNIPNKYSQKMLLAAVDEHHHGYYDFFYLPIDFKNKCNVGYAFINFINFRSIVPFYEAFNNKKWEKFNSEKVCEITYARIQGKTALIGHFQNSSLMSYEDKKCRPIIIFHRDGQNMGEQKLFPTAVLSQRKASKGKDDKPDGEYIMASLS